MRYSRTPEHIIQSHMHWPNFNWLHNSKRNTISGFTPQKENLFSTRWKYVHCEIHKNITESVPLLWKNERPNELYGRTTFFFLFRVISVHWNFAAFKFGIAWIFELVTNLIVITREIYYLIISSLRNFLCMLAFLRIFVCQLFIQNISYAQESPTSLFSFTRFWNVFGLILFPHFTIVTSKCIVAIIKNQRKIDESKSNCFHLTRLATFNSSVHALET